MHWEFWAWEAKWVVKCPIDTSHRENKGIKHRFEVNYIRIFFLLWLPLFNSFIAIIFASQPTCMEYYAMNQERCREALMPIDINALVEVKRRACSECPWGHSVSALSSLVCLLLSRLSPVQKLSVPSKTQVSLSSLAFKFLKNHMSSCVSCFLLSWSSFFLQLACLSTWFLYLPILPMRSFLLFNPFLPSFQDLP